MATYYVAYGRAYTPAHADALRGERERISALRDEAMELAVACEGYDRASAKAEGR